MTGTESKLDAAKRLARFHFAAEPDTSKIFLLEPIKEGDPREPIKLLEVVEGAIERGIEPVAFAANPGRGVPFATWIVELSPSEFARIDPKRIPFRRQTWQLGPELSR